MRGAIGAVLVAAISFLLFSGPANAQATRTWVSGVGDDANPCSRTAPCKTFAGAISKTAPGGEINVLDPGGFGAVTITKSITISSVGFEAGVLVSGTNGIVVSAATTDRVLLEGLDIEGLGTGLSGVLILNAGQVIIRNSKISHFTTAGVNFTPSTASAPAPRVVIQNSFITGNGSGTVNSGGVNIDPGANGIIGNAEILNSVIEANVNFNLRVDGSGTTLLNGSVLTGTSPTNIIVAGNHSLISFGNNALRNGGAPTSTTPLQ